MKTTRRLSSPHCKACDLQVVVWLPVGKEFTLCEECKARRREDDIGASKRWASFVVYKNNNLN